jgi:hypothetical protein
LAEHRIISVEMGRARATVHEAVTAVCTSSTGDDVKRWPLTAVLKAMNSAERFYTEAANGRHARVQRYMCGGCHLEHIRTHVSDGGIDDLALHRAAGPHTGAKAGLNLK